MECAAVDCLWLSPAPDGKSSTGLRWTGPETRAIDELHDELVDPSRGFTIGDDLAFEALPVGCLGKMLCRLASSLHSNRIIESGARHEEVDKVAVERISSPPK